MLDILITLITEALKKISDTSLDALAAKVKQKRSLAVSLFQLYDAMVELETASAVALTLFREYCEEKRVPLRTKARKALDDLGKAVDTFVARLRDSYAILRIYDSQLLTTLEVDVIRGKEESLFAVNVIVAAVPRVKLAGPYPTNQIVVPTALPLPPIKAVEEIGVSSEGIKQRLAELKDTLAQRLKRQEVDFSSPDALRLVLHNADASLNMLRTARHSVAEFVKTNLPLSDLLDA